MSLDERVAKVFRAVFGIDIVDDSISASEHVRDASIGVVPIDDSLSITRLPEWDSLAHITLLMELEDEFGVEMLVEEAVEWTSVGTIKAALIQRGVEC